MIKAINGKFLLVHPNDFSIQLYLLGNYYRLLSSEYVFRRCFSQTIVKSLSVIHWTLLLFIITIVLFIIIS